MSLMLERTLHESPMFHRTVCLLFAALFVVGAGIQWNDPDPAGWALIYLAAAALSVWEAFGRPRPVFAVIVGVAALVWAGRVPLEWFEEVREVVGLVIIGLWALLGVAFRSVRRSDRGSDIGA